MRFCSGVPATRILSKRTDFVWLHKRTQQKLGRLQAGRKRQEEEGGGGDAAGEEQPFDPAQEESPFDPEADTTAAEG